MKDPFPLLRINENLDCLRGAQFFSTLDLASGYWQVEVEPEDRPKTAFTTTRGHYDFQVMPFGLCNAAATFQRLMELVLQELAWDTYLLYLDDIIIFSRSFEEHLQGLDTVLSPRSVSDV